jgi:predicted nucleic acid-binding protein
VTLYLDTSDLVKLYIDEPGADSVRRTVSEASAVATSGLAYPETRATFARRRQEKLLTPAEHRAVVRQFDADWGRFIVMPLGRDDCEEAGRLADAHALRGADAVHLAAFAALLGRCEDDDVRFFSSDARLTRAARRLA